MITLSFASPALDQLANDLRHPKLESAAILLATPVDLGGGDRRLLVRDIHVARDEDYVERTPLSVTLQTEFCLPIEKRAKVEELSLIYCHTHPHARAAEFSTIDDSAEHSLKSYLDARAISAPHAALLFAGPAIAARRLGSAEPIEVVEVGADLRTTADLASPASASEIHDRQILAFGAVGHERVAQTRVGVVGLGGTGSVVVQQLAHLGVQRFILVDPDVVETTNLNRLVGARPSDARSTPKVEVARRQIKAMSPSADVAVHVADVTSPGMGEVLAVADIIFSCTDTHSSRHLLNQLAYQYHVPVIDMGVSITVTDVNVQLAGHVKMLSPGLPCLWCVNHLDSEQVRVELMTDAQRAADPYFQGGPGVPQPAVISINGVVASLAVTMFLSAVAGVPSPTRYVLYDGNRGRTNSLDAQANPECPFCGPFSTLGLGANAPLPARA